MLRSSHVQLYILPERKGQANTPLLPPQTSFLRDMSTYVFVLAAEIPLFLLQVNVFIAAIKLARQNGRYRGFFILYSLQNFAEIVAYVSVSCIVLQKVSDGLASLRLRLESGFS